MECQNQRRCVVLLHANELIVDLFVPSGMMCHLGGFVRTTKRTIRLDQALLARLDQLVRTRRMRTRSRALQEALRDMLNRLDGKRLDRECAKLDPQFEQALAEEGLNAEASGVHKCNPKTAAGHSMYRCRTRGR